MLLLPSINSPYPPPPDCNIKRLSDLITISFTAEEFEKAPDVVAIQILFPFAEPNCISGYELLEPMVMFPVHMIPPVIVLSPDVKDTAFSDVNPSHAVHIFFSFLLIDNLGFDSPLPTANCIP